jgi:hypothetical protein
METFEDVIVYHRREGGSVCIKGVLLKKGVAEHLNPRPPPPSYGLVIYII